MVLRKNSRGVGSRNTNRQEGKDMIDIHSHLIYGMDDGAPTVEESVKMLQQAKELGINTILATPHFQENLFQLDGIARNFIQMVEKAWEYGITLKQGCEVYISPFVDKLIEEQKMLLLNRANYILLELPYESIPLYTYETIYKLQLQRITIIIAHPERNMNLLKDFRLFVDLLERGCLMQLDAGSIVGAYGRTVKNYARKLLKLKLVHFVASDAHCANDYRNWYKQSYEKVRRWAGKKYADRLYIHNPELILENTKESVYEMI